MKNNTSNNRIDQKATAKIFFNLEKESAPAMIKLIIKSTGSIMISAIAPLGSAFIHHTRADSTTISIKNMINRYFNTIV